nr:DNA-protecting protein DprA [Longispora sp. (in: high G+C Gram-positive bacteria)]
MTTLLARVALASLVEPGNLALGALVHAVGPEETIDRLLSSDPAGPATGRAAERLTALGASIRARLAGRDPRQIAERAMEAAHRLGARLVTPEDADWPVQVHDLARVSRGATDQLGADAQPPLCLWVRGDAPLSDTVDRSVAVVGSRSATSYGLHLAAEFGFALAERNWTVVSGGAYGIDAASHRGALAAGGRTVAVLACGVDTVYPLGHTSLFEQIAEQGLIITEWPPGANPYRTRFLVRNRLIAALARGTVVVEAAARSGARNTARWARELNRVLMACPGPATSVSSGGCHLEVRNGHARLVTSVEEILEEVGGIGEYISNPQAGHSTERDGLDLLVARLLDAVPRGRAITAAEIAAAAGLPPSEARRNLPALVARKLVVEDGEGRFRVR